MSIDINKNLLVANCHVKTIKLSEKDQIMLLKSIDIETFQIILFLNVKIDVKCH